MHALLEITGGVIRVWADGHDYPEAFNLSVFVVGHEKSAYIKGLVSDKFTKSHSKAIKDCLKQHGFEKIIFDRWRKIDGAMVKKEITINL